MKKMLTTTALCALSCAPFAVSAFAADLPTRKAPPVFVATGTNWDGFYVGVNFGAAKGVKDWSDPTGGLLLLNTPRFPASGEQAGIFGGVTAGWNHQMGSFVVGVEADVAAASLYGNAVCGGVWGFGGIGWACKTSTDVLASLDLRAGYAVGRALFFAKGGLAYAHDKFEIAESPLAPFPAASVGQSRWGWNIGAGFEYALGGGWSARAEYDFYSFAKGSFSGVAVPQAPDVIGASVAQREHLVKFGLNYRFGAGGTDVSAAAPAIANDLSGEFGGRVGWTTGRFQFTLFDPVVNTQMNSRLTWPGQTGLATEGFARIDHTSGIFAKGFIGGVALFNTSAMHDEDFPPAAVPYSNTISTTKNGNDVYGTGDLGYTALHGAGWRLGAFAGINYFEERLSAYGCTQIAGNPGICVPAGVIPAASMGLSRNEKWTSLRLGIGGDVMVTDRIKIAAEAAWLPWINFSGNDNHWFRPDINPLTDTGTGNNGYQLEAIASYRVTDRLSLGVGARYWQMNAKGHTQFPVVGLPPSPTRYSVNRTTVFVQASYAFGGDPAPAVVAKY
jgi:opacity protein-like surface antigen